MSFEGADQLDALAKFNEAFLDNDWGDGFPLIPPTAESVEEMLTGTTLPRDEVVCLLPPGSGYATVEKIAVNAVMAGCRPEHLPGRNGRSQGAVDAGPAGRQGLPDVDQR